MRRSLVILSLFAPAMLGGTTTSAQDLDYANFEEMFGEPVAIGPTGKPERLSESPVRTQLISADDIRRSGARDLPTLLSRLAGVDIKHSSANASDVGVDGYIQPLVSRVMVLLNGRQVYADVFGGVFWASLPVELEEIRQIEVIHGAQSALYGFNAVDGVINIVTFDPASEEVNMIRGRVGNQGRRELAASVSQRMGEGSGIRLTASDGLADDTGLTNRSKSASQFQEDPDRRMVSANGAVTLPDESRISFELSHSEVAERLTAANLLFDGRLKTDNVKAAYTADTAVGWLNLMGYYSDLRSPWLQAQSFGTLEMDDRNAGLQLSDLFKLGSDDSFRAELETRHDRVLAPGLINEALTGDLLAGSLMWEHHFSPALSMVNAVRYDYFQLGRDGVPARADIFTNADFDRADLGTSASSALVRSLGPDDKLRLSASRGLKLPSLTNLGQMQHYLPSYSGAYYYGNPNLRASAVYSYQGGWEHHLRSLGADATITGFHNMTMSHISSALTLANARPAQLTVMSSGSVTNGLEFEIARKAREGMVWGANYTYQDLHEHSYQSLSDSSPNHKVNANVGYGFGDWEADLYASYVSGTRGVIIVTAPRLATQRVDIKGHAALSPRVAWRPVGNVTVELSAENLWPYRDTVLQRMEASYFLTLRVSY